MEKRVDSRRKQSLRTAIPSHVKSLMFFQFFLILVMGGWLYLEYTHNFYLQTYVQNYLQANPAILQAGIPGVLVGISATLYAKLRGTNRELAMVEMRRKTVSQSGHRLTDILNSLPQLEARSSFTEETFADTQFRRPRGKYRGLNRVSEVQKLPYVDEDAGSN